jgi:hypothetical protein
MKNLLVSLAFLASINVNAASTNPIEDNSIGKCVIEDFDNSISKRAKNILSEKGYNFSDSQSDSNLQIDLEPSCGQGQGPYGECTISITGNIEDQNVYTNSSWIESDVNPFQSFYRGLLNSVGKTYIKNLGDCNSLVNQTL